MGIHLSLSKFKLLLREVIPGELFRKLDKNVFNLTSLSYSYMKLCWQLAGDRSYRQSTGRAKDTSLVTVPVYFLLNRYQNFVCFD